MNGIIVVDKPAGRTSFGVVAAMRKLSGEKKIGHTGTLDPMATGVLPLLLGCATRAAALLEDTDKEYEAGFRLGFSTDTQDSTGKVTAQSGKRADRTGLEAALSCFRGDILQTPPMYSALSVNGTRLYSLARQGIEVEREKRPVHIGRLELTAFDEEAQEGTLSVQCSKGTYIRTLCADLGETLGTYGVMTSLRRTRAAGFTLADAITLDEAEELSARGELRERLLPVESLFLSRAVVTVTDAQARRFSNGGALDLVRTSLRAAPREDGSVYRVHSPQGGFLGLGAVHAQKDELRVLRLFPEEQ